MAFKTVVVEVKERNIEMYSGFLNDENARDFIKEKLFSYFKDELDLTDAEIEEYKDDEWGMDEDSAYSSIRGRNLDYQIFDVEI